MGFLTRYIGICKLTLLLYWENFMSVALIGVDIFSFLHGTLLLLILYKISPIPSV